MTRNRLHSRYDEDPPVWFVLLACGLFGFFILWIAWLIVYAMQTDVWRS